MPITGGGRNPIVAVAIIGAIGGILAATVGIVPEIMDYIPGPTDKEPKNTVNDTISYVAKFGNYGSGDNQFNEPSGIAINSQGHIYVSDKINNRIQVYDSGRNTVKDIISYGNDQKFSQPHGISIDRNDNIYIADLGNNRIVVLDHDGKLKFEFGSFCHAVSEEHCYDPDEEGPLKKGDGQFHSPYGIALDSKDNIYVTDVTSSYVQKFNSTGDFLAKWGGRGTSDINFLSPHGITVDNSDLVYIVDRGNNRIQVFDSNGNREKTFDNSLYDVNVFDEPNGISFDKTSNLLYITNAGEDNFVVLTTKGEFKTKIGSRCDVANIDKCIDGDGNGPSSKGDLQFNDPREIAIDKDKRIYVVDGFNHRIQIFTIEH